MNFKLGANVAYALFSDKSFDSDFINTDIYLSSGFDEPVILLLLFFDP